MLSFGDPKKAIVATLGLNPSKREFLDGQGGPLSDRARRFETLSSLGISDLQNAPLAVLQRVTDRCNRYFEGNPYRFWFDQLDRILKPIGVTYYDGSACHLDLVQWATDPVWGKLPDRNIRNHMLKEDAGFLRQQLLDSGINLLLINGSGVASPLAASMEVVLRPAKLRGSKSFRLCVGRLCGRIDLIAWSINVQSSFGVSNIMRQQLAEEVAEIVGRDRSCKTKK